MSRDSLDRGTAFRPPSDPRSPGRRPVPYDEERMTSAPDTVAAIEAAIAQRFAARIEVDPALSGLDTLATITARRTHRRYLDRPVPAELRAADLRRGPVGAVEKRPAAVRHPARARRRQADGLRRPAAGHALRPRGAGLPRFPRQWTADPAPRGDARQAVPQRPSRSVLQCRRRRGDRAGDIRLRRRSRRSRLLSDQRHPRSRGQGRDPAGTARAGDPACRHVRRLAGARPGASRRGCRSR